uniref:Uncharacterized protein n=1 Tax=Sphaerodactylus townsendi TaxID=933632 RepID=A0ACB8FAC2_9SAUR
MISCRKEGFVLEGTNEGGSIPLSALLSRTLTSDGEPTWRKIPHYPSSRCSGRFFYGGATNLFHKENYAHSPSLRSISCFLSVTYCTAWSLLCGISAGYDVIESTIQSSYFLQEDQSLQSDDQLQFWEITRLHLLMQGYGT